jgi:hypothetical protein
LGDGERDVAWGGSTLVVVRLGVVAASCLPVGAADVVGAVDALALRTVEEGTRALNISGAEGTRTSNSSVVSLERNLDDVAWGGSTLVVVRLGVVAASCLPVGAADVVEAVDALALGTVEDGTIPVKVSAVEGTTTSESWVASLGRVLDKIGRVASSFLGTRLGVVAVSCLTGGVDALALVNVEDGTRPVKTTGVEGTTPSDSLEHNVDDVAWCGSSLLGARLGVVVASCFPVGGADLTRAIDALALGTVEDGTRPVKVSAVEGTTTSDI